MRWDRRTWTVLALCAAIPAWIAVWVTVGLAKPLGMAVFCALAYSLFRVASDRDRT